MNAPRDHHFIPAFYLKQLDGLIERKQRLNRLAELESKVVLSVDEHTEIQHLRELLRRLNWRLPQY
jgi:hypothetical protein